MPRFLLRANKMLTVLSQLVRKLSRFGHRKQRELMRKYIEHCDSYEELTDLLSKETGKLVCLRIPKS